MRLILAVLATLSLIFVASNWYAARVSLPRFCHETDVALRRLAAIIGEGALSPDLSRREYFVAGKLAFLVPPEADESPGAYLRRVRREVEQQCRQ